MEVKAQRCSEMDWQNVCSLICTLSVLCALRFIPFFQPAAVKLNSAFFCSVLMTSEATGSSGWLAARLEGKKKDLKNSERQKRRWKVTFMSHKRSANPKKKKKKHTRTQSSPYLPPSHFHIVFFFLVDYLFSVRGHVRPGHCDLFPDLFNSRHSSWFCVNKKPQARHTLPFRKLLRDESFLWNWDDPPFADRDTCW